MTPDQRILVVGIYISASLYLTGCFVASLFVQHGNGWKFALASMAACYCAYTAQVMTASARKVALGLVALPHALGVTAGLSVLFGG